MHRRTPSGFGFAVLLCLTLVSAGCFGGNGDGNGADGGSGDGGAGAPCTKNTDCSSTQVCTKGTCVDKCQGVVCGNQVCDDTTGNCVGCLSNSDCNGGTCNTTTHTCSGGSSGGQGNACTSGNDCSQSQTCDNGHCQPADYGDCSKLSCAPGYDCKTFQGKSGPVKLCLQPCKQTSDCNSPTDACDTGPQDLASGYCLQSLCGPALSNGVQGLSIDQQASFEGSCNATGANDGFCWGPVGVLQTGTPVGLCFGNGQNSPGHSCDPTASYSRSSFMCKNGLCLPASSTSATKGICAAFCAIADGQTCAPITTPQGNQPTACLPVPNTEVGGVCFPQDPNPAATGASCTAFSTTHQSLSCVSDDTCLNGTCVQLCNLKATTTTCPAGKTCQPDANKDKLLGDCN